MKKENINTVDLKKMFIDSGKEVYHKLDSHWNNQGAAMGCNAILNYLGKDHYDYTNERHTIKKNFSGMGIYCRRCKMAASRDRTAREGKISLWAI